MRELQVCPPEKFQPTGEVRRLQFMPDGAALITTVDLRLHTCDLNADRARLLFEDVCLDGCDYGFGYEPELVLSSDCRFVVYEFLSDPLDEDADGHVVYFVELANQCEERAYTPCLPTGGGEHIAPIFTPSGEELIAVRDQFESGGPVLNVARFAMASLVKSPPKVVERVNPLTKVKYKSRIVSAGWRAWMTLPGTERVSTAAISPDGRLLAVGGFAGVLHVADLDRKKLQVSFPWTGRKLRDRRATRVAFDPASRRVAMLAGGRLIVRPLCEGKPWQAKLVLGNVNDFAFHPSGNFLCAVFADGQARYLDARTGAVKQSFRWSKEPKPLYSVAFAPDGLTCAAGGENGRVVIWDVDL